MMQRAPNLCGLTALFPALLAFGAGSPVYAQDEEVTKQLGNQAAALISVPFQLNYDHQIEPGGEGEWFVVNMRPVESFPLGSDQNLISRTTMPVTAQDDVYEPSPSDDQFAVGDSVQSVFLSPEEIGTSDFVWGARPALLLPIGTNDVSGGEKWGAGPVAVALKQQAGRNVTDDFWFFADDDKWADVDVTSAQPFRAGATSDSQASSFDTETTYEAEAKKPSGPTNFEISKSLKIKAQPIGGGLGGRVTLTFQFPTGD